MTPTTKPLEHGKTSMVDRVAMAIYAASWTKVGGSLEDGKILAALMFATPDRKSVAGEVSDFRWMARAAIEAMREPAEAMLDEGRKHVCFHDAPQAIDDARRVYEAMLDAALSESEK